MIHLLVTMDIVSGKMPEYGEIVTKELVPLYGKLGMKLVASWHGYTGNVNANYSLYVYNDLTDYQKVIALRQKDPDYKRASAKLNALRTSRMTTILEPNAWSPMK